MKTAVRSETPPQYGEATPALRPLDIALIERAKAELLEHLQSRRAPQTEDGKFTRPTQAANYFALYYGDLKYEVFTVMFLDTQHRVIAVEDMFRGTIDSASVYPRDVAKRALDLNAAALILAHNHPSGVVAPSSGDRKITDQIREAVGLFRIRVLDHIISGEGTYSFAEHGEI